MEIKEAELQACAHELMRLKVTDPSVPAVEALGHVLHRRLEQVCYAYIM